MQTYQLHPDQHAILADGEEALKSIDRNETFHDWVRVGRSVTMLREVAMTKAGTDDIDSHAYRTALRSVKTDYPKLAALNKTEASHAVWMWDHHDELETWHRSLPANLARKLNHPSTIWRKNPLGEYREKKPRSSRTEAADRIEKATDRFEEVAERVEMRTAVNPGLDLSTPEMIEASAQTLVDYYGSKPTAALIHATAPLVGTKGHSYDLSDAHYGASAGDFVAVYAAEYGASAIARFADALKAIVTPPAPALDPAFRSSLSAAPKRARKPRNKRNASMDANAAGGA